MIPWYKRMGAYWYAHTCFPQFTKLNHSSLLTECQNVRIEIVTCQYTAGFCPVRWFTMATHKRSRMKQFGQKQPEEWDTLKGGQFHLLQNVSGCRYGVGCSNLYSTDRHLTDIVQIDSLFSVGTQKEITVPVSKTELQNYHAFIWSWQLLWLTRIRTYLPMIYVLLVCACRHTANLRGTIVLEFVAFAE